MNFTGFYWVYTEFYLILLGFTGFILNLIEFYWVLLGFTGFYWVLLILLGLYWRDPNLSPTALHPLPLDYFFVESQSRDRVHKPDVSALTPFTSCQDIESSIHHVSSQLTYTEGLHLR